MQISKVTAIYFSPTGGTEKIVRAAAEELVRSLTDKDEKQGDDGTGVSGKAAMISSMSENRASVTNAPSGFSEINITDPEVRKNIFTFTEGEAVVIGVPTYAGKTPNKLLPYLREGFAGTGAVAIPVVTYGNRNFDNSLAELVSVMKSNGFAIAGAGAFACRHAFTDKLGPGRPDENDLKDAVKLAAHAADTIKAADKASNLPEIKVDGEADAPYYIPKGIDGKPAKFLKAKPLTDTDKCIGCGHCVEVCSMASIDPQDVSQVPGICIKCQACVRGCPVHAKYFTDEAFLSHIKMLEQNYAKPLKPNKLFI